MKNRSTSLLLKVPIIALSAICLLAIWIAWQEKPKTTTPQIDSTVRATQPTQTPISVEGILGAQPDAPETTNRITQLMLALLSFIFAAGLSALLAFRPQQEVSLYKRDPFLAQSQILLSVVGAALMIVVADSAARAFGIFAAAALIRFRTNIRNPKEITVLLTSLAIGLASGVGRWEIASALTLFVFLLLWPLERLEAAQILRAMELEIKTRDFDHTHAVLKKIFRRYRISAELREADAQQETNEPGVILYFLNLSPRLSTDQLSAEIFQADGPNIESVKWEQKKAALIFDR